MAKRENDKPLEDEQSRRDFLRGSAVVAGGTSPIGRCRSNL